MKKKFSQILFRLMMLPLCGTGQTSSPNNNVTIPWENGRVSILSELDPVWIILKKGGPIKKAHLIEIKTSKGIIVYEKEKCLHDLPIQNITRITAGNYSKSALFFDEAVGPIIKTINTPAYDGEMYVDFKFHETSRPNETTSEQNTTASMNTLVIPETKKTNTVSLNAVDVRDTIIKGDGEIIAAQILLITNTRIQFKKLNNPDGPSYILANQPSVKIMRRPYGTKIILPNY